MSVKGCSVGLWGCGILKSTAAARVQEVETCSWQPDLDSLHFCRYLYRHKSDLSFYTLAEEIASPTVYSTVQGIVEKPAEVYPTLQDYIDIFSACESLPFCSMHISNTA